jgi:hypothetical protein
LSKSVLKKCTPLPPAFLANHAGNFTTGWVDTVNPQPFLDADVWPHRTFFDKNINRHSGKPGNLLPWRSGSHHASKLPGRVWQRKVSRKEALRIVQKASKKEEKAITGQSN